MVTKENGSVRVKPRWRHGKAKVAMLTFVSLLLVLFLLEQVLIQNTSFPEGLNNSTIKRDANSFIGLNISQISKDEYRGQSYLCVGKIILLKMSNEEAH